MRMPDAYCVIALWRITITFQRSFTVGENFHGETPSHKTYTCQKSLISVEKWNMSSPQPSYSTTETSQHSDQPHTTVNFVLSVPLGEFIKF